MGTSPIKIYKVFGDQSLQIPDLRVHFFTDRVPLLFLVGSAAAVPQHVKSSQPIITQFPELLVKIFRLLKAKAEARCKTSK